MKVKVIRRFKDKKTGDIRKKGEEFTLSKERFAEIEKVGHFVEEVKSDNNDNSDKANKNNSDKASE